MADTPVATEGSPPYYVFPDTSGQDALFFPSRDAFGRWITGQTEKWKVVTEQPQEKIRQPIRALFQQSKTSLQRFLDAANALATKDGEEQRNALQVAYRDVALERRIPVLAPEYPDFIAQLVKTQGPDIAAAAFASNGQLIDPSTGSQLQLDQPLVRLGIAANQAYLLGLGSSGGDAAQALLQNLGRQYETALAQLRSSIAAFQKEHAAVVADARAVLQKGREDDRAAADQSIADFEIAGAEAVASINATEAAFKEKMKLQASVTYWTEQAVKHRKSESKVRWTLFIYMLLGVPALIFVISALAQLAGEAQGPMANIQYVKYGTIGLLATSLMFWIGRLLLKVMLSERHLAIDAEERTTMVMTYLALTDAGKVEPADRGLALNALFRSGSDGIVKDDAAPDSQIAALLARISNIRGT